ncbi:MAG TPA: c-type cytochrome domain-containing protein [Gemmataceae bacterium]|nr:c-type cytochrome domain-containing protein [Gemmataceae bacterium]
MSPVRSLLLAGGLLALAAPARAAGPDDTAAVPDTVSYYRDVRRVFQQHCQGCHQPAKPQGGFVMTGYADLLKKGDHEQPGVVPGKATDSMIVEQITAKAGKKPAMPKGKDALSPRDVEVITKWIAQGAKDDTPASARDTVDAAHPPVYALPPVLTSVQYSPDGKLLAVSGYHEILLHKADGSGLVARLVGLSERVQALAFSPDGKLLAAAAGSPGRFGEVQVWDVAKRKLKLSVPTTFDTVYGISWSHDATKLAFGCADNTVRAIDAETGKQILYQGAHSDWVVGTAFSKDSTYLASVSRDMTMKLTEVATQRFIDNVTSITPGALKGGLLAVARNPKKSEQKVKNTAAGTDTAEKFYDELLIGGSDGVPRLYKMHRTTKRVIGDDANKLREYPAMPGLVCALAFSPDGSLFAAGSSLDRTGELRVYQTADGKLVSKLEGQPGPVYAVAFRPDGKQVASAGFDGVVRLSDPLTGKRVKEFIPVPLTTTAKK